uniref:Succinate dehydrogenase [ubiquinone] iron-sulfur subunit, mitochondrial n=1 Tax=Pleurostomum flabellatum TaxID=405751 RepID=A0A7T0M4R3_9EUKA|nr:Succinate dehydrogenase [ubiquinone] iron-sulfur subunit [Pleurostomum flabellatum]QPL15604.1 Succinate dehydrogenase [ubiquinone] iron-sulfur subunit [Pleurostomum flabellatum]
MNSFYNLFLFQSKFQGLRSFFSGFVDLFRANYLSYRIYRYDPYVSVEPWIQTYLVFNRDQYSMLLDNLFLLKNLKDNSLSFRRSCREGVCGSCAMNINGQNTLACTYVIKNKFSFLSSIRIFPLPHLPVIKDLIVSMKHFYLQYRSIDPYLKKLPFNTIFFHVRDRILNLTNSNIQLNIFRATKEFIQFDRRMLDGLYECILCACCSTSCPSYWWNQDRYLGPAVLLQSYRWIIDSRDDFFFDRLNQIDDAYKIGRCHSILNCVSSCPKGLNPAEAISNSRFLLELYK